MTEILVVIGVIVLIMAMAVPAFNLIRGSRSADSAENQIAAMLGRARADAIGLQQPHGIMFFIDPASERVNVAEVTAADFPEVGVTTRDVYLDLAPDADYIPLPPGVLAFVLSDGSVVVGTSTRLSDGYLGYNANLTGGAASNVALGGVILFNADGQIISRTYGYRTQLNGNNTKMQQLIGAGSGVLFVEPGVGANPATSAAFATGVGPTSALGFALCDSEAFKSNGDVTDPMFTGAAYGTTNELNEEKWIDDNSSQLIVNRYNGTLTHAD